MTRPTPDEIEEIRETVEACDDLGGPPTEVLCGGCRERALLAEIDAMRGELSERDDLLRHVLTAHPGCRAGCDWANRVSEERRRLAGG